MVPVFSLNDVVVHVTFNFHRDLKSTFPKVTKDLDIANIVCL